MHVFITFTVYFDIDPSVGVAELEAAYNAEKAKAEAIAYSCEY